MLPAGPTPATPSELLGSGRLNDVLTRLSAGGDLLLLDAPPIGDMADAPVLATKVDGRSPVPSALVYEPELDALLQWLPLDLSLPALAEPPGELASELRRHGVEIPGDEPAMLSYRPRRRAVLRLVVQPGGKNF